MTSKSSAQLKPPSPGALKRFIRAALAEDVGAGDITTRAIIPPGKRAVASIVAHQTGVMAGGPVAAMVFAALSARVKYRQVVHDGWHFKPGKRLAVIEGPLSAILTGERLVLNILGMLCGIASSTNGFVNAVKPRHVRILDTRKTAPLLRALQKYAVLAGGGHNHRMRLDSAILIKDNHVAAAGGVARAVRLARSRTKGHRPVEVEVQSMRQLREALSARADTVMLDNMPFGIIEKAAALAHGKAKIEISGGVNMGNIRRLARLKPDYISIGSITQSAPAANLSLKIIRTF